MKPFQFKKFSIQQSKQVFRVGTDGVLLGSMAKVENAEKILEVGTGTGLISLMLAQRNSHSEILAIDINETAIKLATINFENSPFKNKLKVLQQDFKNFNSIEKFDLIVSNPPYFLENNSEKDSIARQQKELSFNILIKKSSGLMHENGLLSVIIPFEAGEDFKQKCFENKLLLQKRTTIFGIKNSKPKRLILEFGFKEKEIVESDLIIEKSPRVYSEEYLELTKDFHQFSK